MVSIYNDHKNTQSLMHSENDPLIHNTTWMIVLVLLEDVSCGTRNHGSPNLTCARFMLLTQQAGRLPLIPFPAISHFQYFIHIAV